MVSKKMMSTSRLNSTPTENSARCFNAYDVSTGSVLFPRPADKIALLAKFRGGQLCPITVQRQPARGSRPHGSQKPCRRAAISLLRLFRDHAMYLANRQHPVKRESRRLSNPRIHRNHVNHNTVQQIL